MEAEAKPLSTGLQVPLKEEEELREQLMFDPRPRHVLNKMVMDSMTHTSLRYWIAVGILTCAGAWSACWACGAT